jgi:hypothetical protein
MGSKSRTKPGERRHFWVLGVLGLLAGCSESNAQDTKSDRGASHVGGDETGDGSGSYASGSGASSSGYDSPGLSSPGDPSSAGDVDGDFGSGAGPSEGEDDGDAASGGSGSSAGGAGGAGGADSADPKQSDNDASGLLTAGAWDDNRNYDFFKRYRNSLYTAGLDGLLPIADHDAAHTLFAQPSAKQTLDVALVIDTTSSMADEIYYLQRELVDISAAIYAEHPNAAQRWSLVVYRDEGDTYVVKAGDFVTDAEAFSDELWGESAGGGGDIPEAPERGLAAAAGLDWRTNNSTAKLLFWVADAPHHSQNALAMMDAIQSLQDSRVHIYPVASSGIDELTEITMRSAAQLTGGRYLFLTDDSGIGNDHKEPSIPCYFVTHLDDAIRRMVDIELSGKYREPAPGDIIRTGGDPTNGSCKLESGQQVYVF